MSYKITLCASTTFFDKLATISDALAARNHTIHFPPIWNWTQESEKEIAKVQHDLMKIQFENIGQSDAIYVANYEKNGIKNYIGGSVFLEIGKAFDMGIPVFLMNDVPNMSYSDEIRAMKPYTIGKDWDKMEGIIASLKN